MATKPKTTQPSSPREFFQRIYGHLEKREQEERQDDGTKREIQELITPVPILASPLPFLLPPGNDTHLTAAAAAGLSAFCKNNCAFFFFRWVSESLNLAILNWNRKTALGGILSYR
jgi:hypothetical protein